MGAQAHYHLTSRKRDGQSRSVSLGITSRDLVRGTDIFGVGVSLTATGVGGCHHPLATTELTPFPVHYREVALTIFKFIAMLRSSPLPVFIQDELRQRSEALFRFPQKTEPGYYVSELSKRLQSPYYPPDQILSAPSLMEDLDQGLVAELIDSLCMEQGRMIVSGQNLDSIAPQGEWEIEKWHGTQYKVMKVDHDFMCKVCMLSLLFVLETNCYIMQF